jgi:anti-sigma-K factor RskA
VEDIKQYIESGILELYVLGDLSSAEMLEVERMAVKHPEIQSELNEIAATMEQFAALNAIEPREELRTEILSKLDSKKDHLINALNTDGAGKVVALQPASQTHFFKYAFAASVALLLVSLVALFNTYNRLQESRQQLVSLQLQNQSFANRVNFQENQLNQYKKQLNGSTKTVPGFADSAATTGNNSNQLIALQQQNQNFSNRLALQANELKQAKRNLALLESQNEKVVSIFSDPSSRFIKLKGMPFSPASALMIAWNPEKKQLFINKKASTLPENDQDHQYQLWAITKLKPVSLGVFDINKKDSIIQSMTAIDKATAFAVTLEPRGGSEKPTLKQMMVMGLAHK